jgi:hypothetical protein
LVHTSDCRVQCRDARDQFSVTIRFWAHAVERQLSACCFPMLRQRHCCTEAPPSAHASEGAPCMAECCTYVTLPRPEPTGFLNLRTATVSQGVLAQWDQHYAGAPQGWPLTGMHATDPVEWLPS